MANKVVGIRFKAVGKKYYFDPKHYELNVYDKVIVETVRGIELGEVIEQQKEIDDSEIISTLKPILRMATEEDIQKYERNIEDIPDAIERCKFHINKNKLTNYI